MTRAEIKGETGFSYPEIELALYALDPGLSKRLDGMGREHYSYVENGRQRTAQSVARTEWNMREEVQKIVTTLPLNTKFTCADLYDKLPDYVIRHYDSPTYVRGLISQAMGQIRKTGRLAVLDSKLPTTGACVYKRVGENNESSRQVVIDAVRAGELRAEGKTFREIADILGVNFYTFNDRRYQDKELSTALTLGWLKFKESKGKSLTALERVTSGEITKPEFIHALETVSVKVDEVGKQRSEFCLNNCFPEDESIGHHVNCDTWTDEERKIMADVQREQEGSVKKSVQAILRMAADDSWDDGAFFPSAYDTLIGILDDGMGDEEKAAVWTLIRYLKRLQADATIVPEQLL